MRGGGVNAKEVRLKEELLNLEAFGIRVIAVPEKGLSVKVGRDKGFTGEGVYNVAKDGDVGGGGESEFEIGRN